MFTLNFSSSPVPSEVIAEVLAEKARQTERERALKYASDMESCQRAVDACKRRLKDLRAAEAAFLSEFKKLEDAKDAPSFASILNNSQVLRNTAGGMLLLEADYEE